MKIAATLFLPLLALFALSGCDNSDKTASQSTTTSTRTVITVGTSPGPYSELFLTAIKPILEQQGYQIKTIEFSNLRQADTALNDGDIDLNVDQHTAYYEDFNANMGGDLIGITQIPTAPAGLYPGKKSHLDNVAQGAKVGIPQDPANMARAYLVLQKAGWITLKEGIEPTKTTAKDITSNKYDLNIIEMDSAMLPRVLPDLDYAVIPGSIVYAANIDANSTLLQEDMLQDLVLVATVKAKNKQAPWALAVVDAYRSDEFKHYLEEYNQNNYWYIPSDLQ